MNYSSNNQKDLLRILSEIKYQKDNIFKIIINTNYDGSESIVYSYSDCNDAIVDII